uniref:Uncharacterized protein n=1 Tax=Meloidogyne enterolobii TaxID=390850 RepID=A0A6V7XFK1_MELEN|nr:unnamed protein product [Meloidogyne enterolobii]
MNLDDCMNIKLKNHVLLIDARMEKAWNFFEKNINNYSSGTRVWRTLPKLQRIRIL